MFLKSSHDADKSLERTSKQTVSSHAVHGDDSSWPEGILQAVFHFLAQLFYTVGRTLVITGRVVRRGFMRVLGAVGRFFARNARRVAGQFDRLILSRVRAFAAVASAVWGGIRRTASCSRALYRQKGLGAALLVWFKTGRRAVVVHKKDIRRGWRYAAPVLAVAVLMTTISIWSSMTFALRVDYNGSTVGYVSSETVFSQALDMMKRRISLADVNVPSSAKYSLAVVSPTKLSDPSLLCDSMITASCEEIVDACGLYIDGEFIAAACESSEIQSALDTYLAGNDSQDTTRSFNNDIAIKPGLYPVDSVKTQSVLHNILDGERSVSSTYTVSAGESSMSEIASRFNMSAEDIAALNPGAGDEIQEGQVLKVIESQPLVSIKEMRTEVYSKTLAYTSETVQDSSRHKGYKKVATKGVNGEAQVTAQVTYVDGVETSRTVISDTVITEPVDEKLIVGTKTNNNSITIASSGTEFGWPVARVARSYISSYYGDGRNHKGIDICAPKGTAIYASSKGTVTAVKNPRSGYGLHLIIDHGNGYQTLYSHCTSVSVSVGQTVAKGQFIATVGSTGHATGNHLHFEIRINGVPYNPAPFLGISN